MEVSVKKHFTERISEYSARTTLYTLPQDFYGIQLELGCGARRTFSSDQPLIGIDITPLMVKTFKLKLNTYAIIGDARKLPFRNRIFKLSVANALLHHMIGPTPYSCMSNIEQCFMEVKRTTTRDGIFHVREMITPNYLITLIIFYTTLIFSKLNININYLYIRSSVITFFLTYNKIHELITRTGYKIIHIEKTPWVVRNVKLGEHSNFDLGV